MSRLDVLLVGVSLALAPSAWSAGTGLRAGVGVGWSRLSAHYKKQVKVSKKYDDTKTALKAQIKKGKKEAAEALRCYEGRWPAECELQDGVHLDRRQGCFLRDQKKNRFLANDQIALFLKRCTEDVAACFPCSLSVKGSRDVTVTDGQHLRVEEGAYTLFSKECGLELNLLGNDDDVECDVTDAISGRSFCSSFYERLLAGVEDRVVFSDEHVPSFGLVGEDTLLPERNSSAKNGVALRVLVGYNLVFRGFRSPVGFSFGTDAFYEAGFGKLNLKLPEAKFPVLQTPIGLQARHAVGVVLRPGVTFGPGNRYTAFVPVTLDLTQYRFKGEETGTAQKTEAEKWMDRAGIKVDRLCEMNPDKGPAQSIDHKVWKFGASAGVGMEVALSSSVSVSMSWQHSLGSRNIGFTTPAYRGKSDLDIERFGVQHDVNVSSQKVVFGLLVRL